MKSESQKPLTNGHIGDEGIAGGGEKELIERGSCIKSFSECRSGVVFYRKLHREYNQKGNLKRTAC